MSQTVYEAAEEFRRAVKSAALGELSFPTSLDASRRVLKAVENPDIGMASLAKIVVAEPLLSAQVIRLANSVALYPTNQVVRDVKQAVVRVGMDPIKSLAMVLIMDQLRHSHRHSGCRDLSNRLWERSIHVAALAFVLILPIPLGNLLPALTIGVFGFSLFQRDGLFAVAGYVLAAFSGFLLYLAADVVIGGVRLLLNWLSGA